MKPLITTESFALAIRMHKNNPIVPILKAISGIDRMNKLYQRVQDKKGAECIQAIFQSLKIETSIKGDLNVVPNEGGCVVICNHPYGGLDGLAILNVLNKNRKDVKVLANFLLKNVEPLSDLFIAVNPLDQKISDKSSTSGLKEALLHVRSGGCLVVFPAGEVSTFQKGKFEVQDTIWNISAIKLIMKLRVPVIPVFFEGGNSAAFHWLGKINANLRTLRLPAELMNKENHKISMRFGARINVSDLDILQDVHLISRFLRAKVYALASDFEVPKRLFKRIRRRKRIEEIGTGPSADVLANEISSISSSKILHQANFDVYCADAHSIPNLLIEIGRLREIAFRSVGEGSNKSLDIDHYDLHYKHLILWDRELKKIAGAYRIGDGDEIMNRFGKKGLYTSSLFKFKKKMEPILSQSIELGRSFVSVEYQKQRWPLFLLWQGIMKYIESKSSIYYVIGPVSMSHAYSTLSKDLIVSYVMKYFSVENPEDYVRARKPFKMKSKHVDKEALLHFAGKEMVRMDKLIAEIDPNRFQIPILFKKYLAQNACIYAFNVDRNFNFAVDAFMLLDISMLSASELMKKRN